MARRILIATPVLSDAATITASDEVGEAVVENLQTIQPQETWAADVLSNLTVTLDLGASSAWNTAALLFTNASAAALLAVRGADTEGELTTNPSYNSGDSARLSGAQFFRHEDAGFGAVSSPFTMEARVRVAALGAYGVVGKAHASPTFRNVYIGLDADGRPYASNYSGDWTILAPASQAVRLHEWTHLSLVRSGSTVSLYVDGILAGSTTFVETYDGNRLEAGMAFPSAGQLVGDLDEIRFWNVARSASDLLTYATREVSYPQSGLLAYYTFDGKASPNLGSIATSGLWSGGLPTWVPERRLWPNPGLEGYDRTHGFLWIPDGTTSRWVRFEVYDPANPAGLFEAGRVYVAQGWQPSRNYQYGAEEWAFDDTAQRLRTPTGQTFSRDGAVLQSARLPLEVTEAEARGQLFELMRTRAKKDVLAVTDPEATDGHLHQRIFYGLLSPRQSMVQARYDRFSTQIELEGLV